MKPELMRHIRNLSIPPALDVLGRFVHCRNARTGTTSINQGPLRDRSIIHSRNPQMWATVWDRVIEPRIDELVVFAFVRNPWDRVCSAFYQCRDNAKGIQNQITRTWEFKDWVKQVLAVKGPVVNMHFANQYDSAYFDGERFAHVGRVEHMEEDWQSLATTLGVPTRLPRWNATGHQRYANNYDSESRQIVAELYQREISAFGYEFGQ